MPFNLAVHDIPAVHQQSSSLVKMYTDMIFLGGPVASITLLHRERGRSGGRHAISQSPHVQFYWDLVGDASLDSSKTCCLILSHVLVMLGLLLAHARNGVDFPFFLFFLFYA